MVVHIVANHIEVDSIVAGHIVPNHFGAEHNEIGYIVPGLGDAGDRIFGTK